MLALAAILRVALPIDGSYGQWWGHFLKLGLVLAIVWLALPETRRLENRIALAAIILVAVALVIRPRLVLTALKNPAVLGVGSLAAVLLALRRATGRREGQPRNRRQ